MTSERDEPATSRPYRHLGGGTLGGLLRAQAAAVPEKTLLQTPTASYTFSELDGAVDEVAHGLARVGVAPGDSVALMTGNRPQYVLSWFGVARAGGIVVPVNASYKADFLGYVLAHSEAQTLVVDPEFIPQLETAAASVAALRRVVFTSSGLPQVPKSLRGPSCASWAEMLDEDGLGAACPPVQPGDVSSLMYTSGTTGRSKAVMTTQVGNVTAGYEMIEPLRLRSTDVLYTALPLFHGNAQMSVVAAMCLGATVAIAERFSASQFWDDIRHYGATEVNMIGSMLAILLARAPSDTDRDHPLRTVFAAPAPPEIMYRFEHRFGVRIIEGFGQTEIKNVTYNPYDDRRPGSVGKPTPTTILTILGEDGDELPPGVTGEIAYRPKVENILCKGYLKDEAVTLEAMRDLWWHTGDLGYRDRDGYFYFVDRKKDVIRRRGENVSSFEVERVLLSHPAIVDCAVVATRSEMLEDEVLAIVQMEPDTSVGHDILFHHCEERMPYFMVPRYFRSVAALPRTENGKIRKVDLRAAGLTSDTWDAKAAGLSAQRGVGP